MTHRQPWRLKDVAAEGRPSAESLKVGVVAAHPKSPRHRKLQTRPNQLTETVAGAMRQ